MAWDDSPRGRIRGAEVKSTAFTGGAERESGTYDGPLVESELARDRGRSWIRSEIWEGMGEP